MNLNTNTRTSTSSDYCYLSGLNQGFSRLVQGCHEYRYETGTVRVRLRLLLDEYRTSADTVSGSRIVSSTRAIRAGSPR